MMEKNLQTPGVYINEVNAFGAGNYLPQTDLSAMVQAFASELNAFFRSKYTSQEDLVLVNYPMALDGSSEPNAQNKVLLCVSELITGSGSTSISGCSLLVMANFSNPLESLKIIQACGDFFKWIAPNGEVTQLANTAKFSIQARPMDFPLQQQIFSMLGCHHLPAFLYTIQFKEIDFITQLQIPNSTDSNQDLIKTSLESDINNLLNQFVFEPNHSATWLHIRYWANKILHAYWEKGFLIGKTANEAYSVNMGIESTMKAQDIIDGLLILNVSICFKESDWLLLTFSRTVAC